MSADRDRMATRAGIMMEPAPSTVTAARMARQASGGTVGISFPVIPMVSPISGGSAASEPTRTALRVVIEDNGTGGADPARGSGLPGIRRRVAALDGTTRIHSPAGHGTTIEVELPCD